MPDRELASLGAGQLARLIADGQLSPVEVVGGALERCAEVGPRLNCFTALWEQDALAEARAAEGAARRGEQLGPLHGVPVAVKDTTPQAGRPTTCGSRTRAGWVPAEDAAVVAALRRAGAIVVATTTAPEFAFSAFTESPLWGVTRNPWDLARTPGGSSGGSAAAVAAGCVPLAEGTDMGGSVRIPAAWCGVVGLKPSLGRIPFTGYPWGFDLLAHHGPLARSVEDARLFLAATEGPDDRDPLSLPRLGLPQDPLPSWPAGRRLALSVDLGCWAVDPEVEAAVRGAAAALESAGAQVEEVAVGCTPRDLEVWGRYWEVAFAAFYGDLLEGHREELDEEVVVLIEAGLGCSAAEAKRLDRERTLLWERLAVVLAEHEALVCPTMAGPPPAAARADRLRAWQAPPPDGRCHDLAMTIPFNLAAPCPALSVPCGWHADGLPIGIQLVGRRFADEAVLGLGAALERLLPEARRPLPR